MLRGFRIHRNDIEGGGSATPPAAALVLNELDVKFFTENGIDPETLKDLPEPAVKAIRLSLDKSIESRKQVTLLDKQLQALKRQDRPVEKREPILPDGTVDKEAVGQLQAAAGKADGYKRIIDMLHDSGQLDDRLYQIIDIGDPEAIAKTMKIMELMGAQTPASGEMDTIKKQLDALTNQIGGQGLLADVSQGTDPALTTEQELAKLGLAPALPAISDMEKIQREREKQRAEAARSGRAALR